jgi:hypothetical protein
MQVDNASISLPIFDELTGIGVGVDGRGAVCLVLPGLENQSGFETQALAFDPWCETTWLEENKALPKSAVLRCIFDREDRQLLRLVSGVLLSLVDLQVRFNDAGNAIWALKELFGDGFKVSVQISVVRGLIGELLLIDAATAPKTAISCWHVDVDDRYDFSVNSSRIEVKTTTSAVRQHRFTSRQLPPIHGINVWVASVQLSEVAVGDTIGSLFDRIAGKVDRVSARKLLDVVVETLGLPPGAILEPQFDLASSVAGIRFFDGYKVPTPEASAGTSDIKWTAYLDEANGVGIEKLDQILNDGPAA